MDLLISKLKEKIDGPSEGKVDLTAWYNFTTFDIIGDLAFGEPFYALENGEYHFWIKNIFQGIKFFRFLGPARHYKLLGYLFAAIMKSVPAFGRARKEHMKFTDEKTQRRLETEVDRQDFISYVG